MNAPPSEMVGEITRAVAKSAPPVTVWALTLNEWVAVATFVYIILQAAYLLRKWLREERP